MRIVTSPPFARIRNGPYVVTVFVDGHREDVGVVPIARAYFWSALLCRR